VKVVLKVVPTGCRRPSPAGDLVLVIVAGVHDDDVVFCNESPALVIVTMMVELLATRVPGAGAAAAVAAAVRGHVPLLDAYVKVVAVTVATATQVALTAVLVAETHTLSPTMRPGCRWCPVTVVPSARTRGRHHLGHAEGQVAAAQTLAR